jgi:hypothetical protein
MRYIPLFAGVLLVCAPAKADKFWLTDPNSKQSSVAGSSPNLIKGVLVAEDDGNYHVRIVGGKILLAKKSVFKIEKDDLTLDAIIKAETDSKEIGRAANDSRRESQQSQQRIRAVRIANFSARRRGKAVEASSNRIDATVTTKSFDPVLGAASGNNSQYEMMRDAQVAWSQTKDRRYLKLLRQLRRMR